MEGALTKRMEFHSHVVTAAVLESDKECVL